MLQRPCISTAEEREKTVHDPAATMQYVSCASDAQTGTEVEAGSHTQYLLRLTARTSRYGWLAVTAASCNLGLST
jgi:hypothetical protein